MGLVQGKRKVKSWGYLSTASVWRGRLLATSDEEDPSVTSNQNKIIELEQAKRDTLYHWQEFVCKRQEQIDKESPGSDSAREPATMMNQLHQLLKEQPEEINDAVTLLLLSATNRHYSKGFYDGMKIAMSMENL